MTVWVNPHSKKPFRRKHVVMALLVSLLVWPGYTLNKASTPGRHSRHFLSNVPKEDVSQLPTETVVGRLKTSKFWRLGSWVVLPSHKRDVVICNLSDRDKRCLEPIKRYIPLDARVTYALSPDRSYRVTLIQVETIDGRIILPKSVAFNQFRTLYRSIADGRRDEESTFLLILFIVAMVPFIFLLTLLAVTSDFPSAALEFFRSYQKKIRDAS